MRLRPGYLQRLFTLLSVIDDKRYEKGQLGVAIPSVSGVESSELIELSFCCGFVEYGEDAHLRLSSHGKSALEYSSIAKFLQAAIASFMVRQTPDWMGVVQRGRSAFQSMADSEVLQCFGDAELLEESLETVEWWDRQYVLGKDSFAAERLRVGRLGEGQSLAFEQERVGRKPDWISLVQPQSPYDLLSFVDTHSAERLLVEVKASLRSAKYAAFFVSSSEWQLLSRSRHAILHLWADIERTPELNVIPIEDLAPHIPSDCGEGKWQSVRIPFSSLQGVDFQMSVPRRD